MFIVNVMCRVKIDSSIDGVGFLLVGVIEVSRLMMLFFVVVNVSIVYSMFSVWCLLLFW